MPAKRKPARPVYAGRDVLARKRLDNEAAVAAAAKRAAAIAEARAAGAAEERACICRWIGEGSGNELLVASRLSAAIRRGDHRLAEIAP